VGRRSTVAVVLSLALLSACGVKGSTSGSSDPDPTPTSAPKSEVGLVAADHPECQQLGEAILQYLTTGDTSDEPEIEQAYADTRAAILAQPQEARDGVARARASDAIASCDARLYEQAAAQAEAEAQAEAQEQADREAAERQRQQQEEEAAAAEAERQQLEHFAQACEAVGGEAEGLGCTVDYPGWPDMYVPMDDNGELIADDVAANREDCATGLEDAQISADEGYPWSELPQFHEDSGVCTYGTP
jgi:hypothetical protein